MKAFLWLLLAISLSGCLYSTHQYNSGRVLSSGRTQVTLGLGRQPLYKCLGESQDSLIPSNLPCTGAKRFGAEERVEKTYLTKGSLNYRLGIRDKWGVFPGVELNWHLEAPTNPATMEFGLRAALPSQSAHIFHNLGLGWGIGVWADNTFFAEYALGGETPLGYWYSGSRILYLATQIGTVLQGDFESQLAQDPAWIFQTGLGAEIRLPRLLVVPDLILPHFRVTFPGTPSGQKAFYAEDLERWEWDLNLGLGWTF